MKTRTKVWLIIAASLVLIGCILFVSVMRVLGWDFMKLATVTYETNTYTISEAFDSISVNTDTADIVFAVSDNGKCTVQCREEANAKHSVAVKNGTLTIMLVDERAVYDYIRLSFGSPKITVSLPQAEYASLFIREDTGDIAMPKGLTFKNADISLSTGDVAFCASASERIQIKTTTGDIRVENTSADALDLSVSTGKVTVSGVSCTGDIAVGVSTGKAQLGDIRCKSVLSRGSTGDISLKNVIATEKFSIVRDTGDVLLDACDAAELFIETDTGNVKGTLLSDKIFITETDTGRIKVPNSTTGGRCQITTDTGDIKIDVIP